MEEELLRIATDAYIKQLEYRIHTLKKKVKYFSLSSNYDLDEIQEQIENTNRFLEQVKAFRKTI